MRVIVITHGFAWGNFRKEHSGGAASSRPHSRALASLRRPADSLGARDPTGHTRQVWAPLLPPGEKRARGRTVFPCRKRLKPATARGAPTLVPRRPRPARPTDPAALLWGSMLSCSRAPKGRARGAAAAAPNASRPRQASLGLP